MNLLIISNGHGEDLNGSLIGEALMHLDPQISVAALPIVGAGTAYERRSIKLLFRGRDLPSGGMVYQGGNIWRDIASGWIQQTFRQVWASWRFGRRFSLVLSVGDHVPLFFAWLTGRPTVVFLVSTSSYYEGRLRLSRFTRWLCGRSVIRLILTRDAYTAADLQSQGLAKARFLGYPIMDALETEGMGAISPPSVLDEASASSADIVRIALLPGSRLPEAWANLVLMLSLCERLKNDAPEISWSFDAAVVPGAEGPGLAPYLKEIGWIASGDKLYKCKGDVSVSIRSDRFADTLRRADLVVGMAGTAVEQAVGLAKPVVQLVGQGPQFSYAFAEAQMRLLGDTVFTVGRQPAGPEELRSASRLVVNILKNPQLALTCRQRAAERVGPPGGSGAIAKALRDELSQQQASPALSP